MGLISIEKKQMIIEENYVGLEYGGKKYECPVGLLKSIFTFWLFCAVCFMTYMLAQLDQQNNVMIAAYLSGGRLLNDSSGQLVSCQPTMSDKSLIWNCTSANKMSTLSTGNTTWMPV